METNLGNYPEQMFNDLLVCISQVFKEDLDVVKKGLGTAASFDELIVTVLASKEAGVPLEEALNTLGDSYFNECKRKVESFWKGGMVQ